jgi:hypothetical protein
LQQIRCRDHDHLTGLYRGAACRKCNLNNRKPRILPIFFHNLSGYDAHHIVRKLSVVPGEVDVIPNTSENYISFTKKVGNISCRFLDSFRFMSTGLSKLADNLPRDGFKETSKFFKKEQLDLVVRKGIFCYDFVDSLEKLNYTSLPTRDEFYSMLTESHVTDADYKHAEKIWEIFKCKNLGEYSDIYLKCDVLILSDVFECFRNLCLKNYELDPCYYFTAAGYSWDAALKETGVTLELFTDYDMLLFVEAGIRGGISQVIKRHAKANNPYLSDYDSEEPESYIFYTDCNNLYGAAQSDFLPYGGFEWILDPVELAKIDIENLKDDGEIGYFFEVDVEYPNDLHDKHSDLPFLAESMCPPGSTHKKLLTTLYGKQNYIVHFRSLKQALKHGLKIKKVHRALKFNQSCWLKSYIMKNTDLRKLARNDFERDFFKLLNNAVYGKSMENVRNRIRIKIVVSEEQLKTYVAKATFLDRTIFTEEVAAIHLAKERIIMNKPIYVGMAILDISKTIMYDFHYSVMATRFDNISICYMDTDAFLYHIYCEDLYEVIKKMQFYFDTSDYPPNHKSHCLINKRQIGKFKDETNSVPIKEACCLRSKMYSLWINGVAKKKLKGVKSYAVKMKLTFKDYLDCLYNGIEKYTSFHHIRSQKHVLYTMESNKKSLSPHDDKRYIVDGINTLPYGHCTLNEVNMDLHL